MTHETLTEDQLETSDGKKLLRYINIELLKRDHRIAQGNKLAGEKYLRTHEDNRLDQLMKGKV